MKKIFVVFFLIVVYCYAAIGFWNGSNIIYEKNKIMIDNFIEKDRNQQCKRIAQEISCGGYFDTETKEIKEKINENTEKGITIISISVSLTGWSNIYCNKFDIVAFDFLWPVRWLEKSGVVGTQK